MSDPVAELAFRAGILPAYRDLTRTERITGRETQLALLSALGLGVTGDDEARARLAALDAAEEGRVLPPWMVAGTGQVIGMPEGDWLLETESGRQVEGRGELPDLPIGIHALWHAGHETVLLVAPPSLPEPARAWGLTVPLWGLSPTGLGDFGDLRTAGEAAARHGAAFLGINPIHAGFPLTSDRPSPYRPSHRRRLNAMHLTLDTVASADPFVEYEAEYPARLTELRDRFERFEGSAAFDAFREAEGRELELFAAHQALSARYGPFWNNWPAAAQSPDTAPPDEVEDEADFHAWLQWRAHEELTGVQSDLLAAGMDFGLYLDLAVGTHPHGAETWADPGSFARGVSLGAPPDPFAPRGQTWALAPLDPRALVAGRFRVLAETLRQQLRYSRLLRIDHILGFERAFWVPEEPGLPGAYVAMPRDAMLAVVRIEAARAGATVIGEDLGNIPGGLQDALAASGIFGCRLVQFEEDGNGFRAPESYALHSLASFGTHDLPTYLGWRDGQDIAARATLGHLDDEVRDNAFLWRAELVRRFDAVSDEDGTDTMHGFLARSASALVAVQVEDVLEVVDQSNLPGTVDDYPNWRRRLPVPCEALADDARLDRVATIMRDHGR